MAQDIKWQKSSFSAGQDAANCVELAAVGNVVLLRESDAPANVLALTRPALVGLLGALRQ
ncbi:DUF397 domain-containing protein [Streptomyces sp. NPDC050610]|uniref:DUF397 domain-containing protein n=1 Tax=Streptomyces sp. NPDC050610 TaxID=3157097 RepID=UPI003422F33B